MFKTKILILGPCQSGKSTIANFLSDASEVIGGEYRPTQGVRIVEFESNDLEINNKNIDAEVELWDCSGDKKSGGYRFERCWPAIQKDANGVILVCNPDVAKHSQELETWFTHFVARRGIALSHVVIFLHSKPESSDKDDLKLSAVLSGVRSFKTNIEQDGDSLRIEFNNFLCNVIAGASERRENEELSIMG